MKKLALLFQACMVLMLVGCIEFDEVVQLRPDGHVDFTLTVLVPELPDKKTDDKTKDMDKELEEVFNALGGAKLLGKGEETKFGKQRVWFSASLPSLNTLGDIYSGIGKGSKAEDSKKAEMQKGREALDHIFSQRSNYKVEKTKQGSLRISREFKPGKIKEKKPDKKDKESEELSKNMEEMMMNSMTFRFEFFSPTEVLSSNATGKFGQVLRWEASLGYLSKNPFKMEFEIAATPELEAALLKK